jgi:hypothetical protein
LSEPAHNRPLTAAGRRVLELLAEAGEEGLPAALVDNRPLIRLEEDSLVENFTDATSLNPFHDRIRITAAGRAALE